MKVKKKKLFKKVVANKKKRKISQIFGLNRSQFELDFVDIDIYSDTPLFVDSAFLKSGNDEWTTKAIKSINSFFSSVLSNISNDNIDEAKSVFLNFIEPKETCLGLSEDSVAGNGPGKEKSLKIFNNLLTSKASQSGLLKDIEDFVIFVDDFGRDNLSDMITNIIKLHLIEYTQEQARLWNLPLQQGVSSGQFWDSDKEIWDEVFTEMLVINEKKIVLVPKHIVVWDSLYTKDHYYNRFALEFLQARNKVNNTPLVQLRKDQTPYVTKSSLKENTSISHIENGFNICSLQGDKKSLNEFSDAFPSVFDHFKTKTLQEITKSKTFFNQQDISEQSIFISKKLLAELSTIKHGNSDATKFHNWSIATFEFLFFGKFKNPIKEKEIHNGSKRIDISFCNYSESGPFFKLQSLEKYPCQYIYIECKNYSKDINNPELDQLSGRFSPLRGRVGILHFRDSKPLSKIIKKCGETYSDDRGLIIPIEDRDMIEALESFFDDKKKSLEKIIEERIIEVRA
jgi:hypothetical protein